MNNRLIVADSQTNADLLYATGLFVPDPFIYFETGGKSHAILSDLEIDRARKVARVDRVLSYSRYVRKLRAAGNPKPRLADVLLAALREFRMRSVETPHEFPHGLATQLRGITVKPVTGAFYPQRAIKAAAETRRLARALEIAEAGMAAALRALRSARIARGGGLVWRGRKLTAADVQGVINATCAALGGAAAHTIVACGDQACDPHEAGHGPLRAHQTIIVDIFPRDTRTGYWGDITRTVVRGRASAGVKQMFSVVNRAQELAFQHLRDGAQGEAIHNAIRDLFRRDGFRTGRKRGRMQGFFHGTGHGLGLEIHEAPRIGAVAETLRAGQVVTVEPGLYYPGLGGVRLEDVALIQARGARNLTSFPKFLEI